MREPYDSTGEAYSLLSSEVLRNFSAGCYESGKRVPTGYSRPDEPWFDLDFRRRYAAILLQERGQ